MRLCAGGRGEGDTQFVHGRSRMTMDPRVCHGIRGRGFCLCCEVASTQEGNLTPSQSE